MNILYNRLFNLTVFHDYYKDGKAKNIYLKPTEQSSELLRDSRMLFRKIPGGVTVLYRTLDDETTPFVNAGPVAKLVFTLETDRLRELLNITDFNQSPSKKFKSGNVLYFKNDPAAASDDPDAPEDLAFELLDFLSGSLFTYEFKVSSPPPPSGDVLLTLNDEDGTTLLNETVSKAEDDTYRLSIDLRGRKTGKYTLTVKNPSDSSVLSTTVFYMDDTLAGQNTTGIVSIAFDAATNRMYQKTWAFALRLKRKSTVWKYFIVDKNKTTDFDAFRLSIEDKAPSDPELPYAPPYVFTRIGTEPNDDVSINGLDTVIFKSEAAKAIPFYEQPKFGLQLKKISSDPLDPVEVILIQNLPNPRHNGLVKEDTGKLESEIFVFI